MLYNITEQLEQKLDLCKKILDKIKQKNLHLSEYKARLQTLSLVWEAFSYSHSPEQEAAIKSEIERIKSVIAGLEKEYWQVMKDMMEHKVDNVVKLAEVCY